MIWDILFNIGYWVVKGYLSTPSSTKDEKLLDLAKNAALYLASKNNNDVTYKDYYHFEKAKIKGV